MSNRTKLNITPDVILRAYMLGVFPMAETKESKEIFWVDPESRGVLPFDKFHIPKSLVVVILYVAKDGKIEKNGESFVNLSAQPAPRKTITTSASLTQANMKEKKSL